jgi:hypothetical protein
MGISLSAFFSQDQVENLQVWRQSLQREVAQRWKVQEDKAEVDIQALFAARKFPQGEPLSPDDFDQLFRLMKKFSANRNLSKLLYINNDIAVFNQKLWNLYYDEAPFPKRVDDFFKLKSIGTQTLSPFLVAFDPSKYPLITSLTKDALELDAEQEQSARVMAVERFGIAQPQQYLERTIGFLRDFVIFEQVKELLELEKYTAVNNLIWFATRDEGEGPDEALESYASVSLENDLRDSTTRRTARRKRLWKR